MSALTSVSVHHNLTSCETGVAVRSSDHKLAGGVDMKYKIFVKHSLYSIRQLRLYSREQNLLHILLNLGKHSAVSLFHRTGFLRRNKVVMLSGNNDGVHTHRLTLRSIFNCHLALGVRTQVGHHLAFTTHLRKLSQQKMAEVNRKRHIIGSFIASISKHHTLVAGALLLGIFAFHATVYVGTLFMQSGKHATGVSVKHQLAAVITDPIYHATGHLHKVNVSVTLNLSGNHHLTCGHKSFASHFR